MKPDPPDRTQFREAMIAACGDLGVQPVETLFEKVVQVYEMMIVRHGFMLVGMPWAGKTIAAKVRRCSLLRAVKCCWPQLRRWTRHQAVFA